MGFDKVDAKIFSFYMNNIHPETVRSQAEVVNRFLGETADDSGIDCAFQQILTGYRHAHSIDIVTRQLIAETPVSDWEKTVLVNLDIDAIPLNGEAFRYLIESAVAGAFVGNIQRSNHIQNDQHVFIAPSASAITLANLSRIGIPSAEETYRGDVLEEWTYAAEDQGVKLDFLMPVRYESAPAESAFWDLKDGQPKFGRGTTFANRDGVEMFWHSFQIFHPGSQERFWQKCAEVLGES